MYNITGDGNNVEVENDEGNTHSYITKLLPVSQSGEEEEGGEKR